MNRTKTRYDRDDTLQPGALYEICAGGRDGDWLALYLDVDVKNSKNFVRWLKRGEVFLVVEKVGRLPRGEVIDREADICCILTSSGVGYTCEGLTPTGAFVYINDVKKLT